MRQNVCTFFSAAMISLMAPAISAQQKLTCSNELYATDFDRLPITGSKQQLIEAVIRGENIRVGWELDFDDDNQPDLAHWANAAFLTVFEGQVFTQLEAIHAQIPRQGTGNVEFPEKYTEWRGSLGSDGKLIGAYSSNKPFPSDLKVRITWCSKTPQK